MGFLGIDTPEEHGGIGGDFITSSIVMEEQYDFLPFFKLLVFNDIF